MKIWRLECSHGGDPLYTWAFFKNKPDVQLICKLLNEANNEASY